MDNFYWLLFLQLCKGLESTTLLNKLSLMLIRLMGKIISVSALEESHQESDFRNNGCSDSSVEGPHCHSIPWNSRVVVLSNERIGRGFVPFIGTQLSSKATNNEGRAEFWNRCCAYSFYGTVFGVSQKRVG